jgi:ferredoxin/flavodoxin---NADP+ reductase
MARLGTSDRPLRVAIVGAGPAGLYAAQALLDQPDLVLTIDFGVDLHHHDLKRLYDQIVFAVGAQADRRMSIPGEDLPNSLAALAFVGWYNGHPDYRDLEVDLGCQRAAVVVGNGNVAMDVTRMLVRSHDELARTDMADHALEALAASRIREVVVLGRRGAAQASFTTPELRELGRLEGVDVVVDPANIELDPASKAGIEDDRAARANLRHLQGYAARTERSAPRRITLRFLASPVEVLGSNGRVEAVRIERNELIVDHNGGLRSKGTGQFEVIEAGLVLRSIGYRTVPIEGVPFDPATSTVNNIAGQITHPNSGEVTPGEYVAGWAKRGPTGRIGNNKPDSASTVAAMMADLPTLKGIRDDLSDPAKVEALLRRRGIDYACYADWRALDAHEVALGAPQGRPRVKVCAVPEMMEIIRRGR